jgi:hypothetical protein
LSPALVTLESAKAGFLNRPTRQSYSALETQCAGLTGLLRTAGENGSHVASVRCGTLAGSQMLLNVFAANTALAKFQEGCGKTRKLTGLSSDEIFQTGQSCIQLSGLNSAIAGEFLTDLRQVAMRRDDRAHRFVVTWNAFFDTNPLAFVALFIALSIDGLVFITGLFGASAEAGLRLVPGRKPSRRHAHALSESRSEAVLDFALLPDVTGTARLLLEHLVPAPLGRSSGLAGELDLSAVPDEKAERLRTVLNTACTLRLAERPESGDRYVLRTGLIDHLSERLGWQRGVSAGTWVECNPEEMLAVALGRQRRRIGHAILEHAEPVSVEADHAYALEIADCPVSMQGRITSVLNTAVAGGTVSGDPASERRYLLTAAFVSLLTRLAAGEPYGETGADDAAEPADLPSLDTPERSVSSAASEHISEHFVADIFGESGPDADVGLQVPDAASEKRPEKPNTVPGLAHDERQSQALAELHDEAPVSSKLITFPVYSRTRQQTRPDLKSGQAQSGQAQSDQAKPGQAQTELGDDLLADRETLEKAVSGLVAGSSIAPHEAIGWVRSGAGPKFDDGWTCIRQMCLDDRQFETELAGCELKARRKIDRFREALKAGDAVGPGETDGSALESEPDPAIRVYRPYLMRRYAMDMAMAWCMNALREFEDNAVFGANAKAREQQLQTIEDIAARLSPLDEEHRHEWSEIGMRAGGLGRQDSELEAFSDLMP